MKINFGKHAGEEVASLPKRYLKWLANNVKLQGDLLHEIHYLVYGTPRPEPAPDGADLVPDFEAQINEMEKENNANG